MKNIIKTAGFGILILAVMSCSLAGKLVEKGLDKGLNTKRADSLWSDVPRMDGLNDSVEDDLPITIKLALHTFVNLLFKGMEAKDPNPQPVNADWIFYKYKGNAADIKNFYTAEKMKIAGNWSLKEGMTTPCMDGSDKGLPGDVCLFQKTENGKQEGLIIIGLTTKEKDNPGIVYFIRAETTAGAYGNDK